MVLAASEKLELRGHNRAAPGGLQGNSEQQQVKKLSTCSKRARRILLCSDGLIDVCLPSCTLPQN